MSETFDYYKQAIEVLAINQAKLEKRYSSGKYSNQQAQARVDKE